MTRFLLLLLTIQLTACATTKPEEVIALIETEEDLTSESIDEQTATYYVVVADTNADYYILEQKMVQLSKEMNREIETMGRSYNAAKDLIALPEDDEDEMYAGSYFPRRYPDTTLSLEYLNFYKEGAGENTIALVTGIYEAKNEADTDLKLLRKLAKNAFLVEAEIYIGCMH